MRQRERLGMRLREREDGNEAGRERLGMRLRERGWE